MAHEPKWKWDVFTMSHMTYLGPAMVGQEEVSLWAYRPPWIGNKPPNVYVRYGPNPYSHANYSHEHHGDPVHDGYVCWGAEIKHLPRVEVVKAVRMAHARAKARGMFNV